MTHTEEVKEAFYGDLDGASIEIPRNNKLIILGNCNAQVGYDLSVWRNVIGKHGVVKTNANGLLLLEKCSQQRLVITNTIFQQSNKYKTT